MARRLLAPTALLVAVLALGCPGNPAGPTDAGGAGDAGPTDAGTGIDAGERSDAGTSDAGGGSDAGGPDAGGVSDAGYDGGAGVDAGFDGGTTDGGTTATVPSPPTSVVASAGNKQATVSWSVPSSNGGSPLLSYRVTSSPGGLTATVPATRTRTNVNGLTNGTTYTFTVVAHNAIGDSAPSAPSNPVTPELVGLRLPQPPLGWTSGAPCAMALGDFDEDGNLDVAAFSYDNSDGTSFLSTFLGVGNGALGARLDVTGVGCPVAVRVGDFDQDGHLDLAIISSGGTTAPGTLEVYYGLGDGTFSGPISTAVGIEPGALAVADFNSDGLPDVAVPSFASNNVRVLLSQASRTFVSAGDFPTATSPNAIAAGDMSGHGRADLVLGCAPSIVQVLVDDGTGQFSDGGAWDAGYRPIDLAVADVNRDGHADVVALDIYGFDVLLGNGAGVLGPASHVVTAGNGIGHFAVADLNGDGSPDVTFTLGDSWALSVFLGRGDGTFSPEVMYLTDPRPGLLAVADLDKDGHLDVLVASDLGNTGFAGSGLGSLQPLMGKGDGSFPTWQTIATNFGNAFGIAEGDLNGDGSPDLVASPGGDYRLSFALDTASGAFPLMSQQVIAAPGTSFVTIDSPVIADLNGDGKQDIAAASTTRNTLVVLMGQGNGNFQPYVEYSVSDSGTPFPNGLAFGDFNGDGRVDLVSLNGGAATVSVLLGKDGGTYPSYVEYASGPAGSYPSQVRTAHIGTDVHQDLIVAHDKGVSLFLGNGDGTFQPRIDLAICSTADEVTVGDFNGDGIPDLVVGRSSAQQVVVAFGASDGSFPSTVTLSTWPMPGSVGDVAVGDFDGDGNLDIAASSSNGGSFSGWISVFPGQGDGGFGARQDFSSARSPYRLVTADFNHDGKTDLAASCNLYPNLMVLLNGSLP